MFVFIVFSFLGDIVLIVVSVLIGIKIGVLKELCGVCIMFSCVFVCLYFFINL